MRSGAPEPSPRGTLPAKADARSELVWLYVLTIGATLAAAALLIVATGNSVADVARALLDGAFLAPGRRGDTLKIAGPILMVAVGMVIGVKAGFFNIGQEGQLLVGAMAMALIGTKIAAPGPLPLVGGLVLGAVAGGSLAALAALMRFRRGVPETISTLLLVFVVYQVIGYAVTTAWFLGDPDPRVPGRITASAPLTEEARLPIAWLFGEEIHFGFPIGLAMAGMVTFFLSRTGQGFKLRLLGSNPDVAHQVGVDRSRFGTMALFASGALAGFGGAVMLAGGASGFRLTTGFSTEVGWQGLLVALVARSNPLLCIPIAVVFAALRTGGAFLAATGVDRTIVGIVQALLVLALLIPPAVQSARHHRTSHHRFSGWLFARTGAGSGTGRNGQ